MKTSIIEVLISTNRHHTKLVLAEMGFGGWRIAKGSPTRRPDGILAELNKHNPVFTFLE